ncbi:MAG TPA: metallophosphoesterase family protein [Geminicoccaceae bacterium]
MTVFFTADTHFGHGGALGLYRRPFESVAAMDRALIERWNAVVRPSDLVWHLGDLVVRPKPGRVDQLLDRLAGEKHLILGNNDGHQTATAGGWASVRAYAETTVDDVALVLCHYPFRSWNRQARGAWNLHGHSHGRLAPMTRQVDVGVDAFDFRPVTLAEITARRRGRRRDGATGS